MGARQISARMPKISKHHWSFFRKLSTPHDQFKISEFKAIFEVSVGSDFYSTFLFSYNSAYKACLSHLDKYFRGNHARHDEKESIKNGEEFWIDAGKFGVDGKKTIRITSTESNALKNSIIDRLERHIIVGEACPVCYATVDEFREELEVISSFGNGPIHVREFALSLEIVGYKSGYDREYIERLKQIKTVFSSKVSFVFLHQSIQNMYKPKP